MKIALTHLFALKCCFRIGFIAHDENLEMLEIFESLKTLFVKLSKTLKTNK